jgi:creatinine amidohydrolase
MEPEVRYHMLRPDQIAQRREDCPIAYIPVGNIEWHGRHNPTGADTLQAEGLAVQAARIGGGLAMPPLYYGDSLAERKIEADCPQREEVAELMGLPPENFDPARQPFTATEQVLNYQKLLLHLLAQVESLGFMVGVLLAGHYPLVDHCRAASLLHNQAGVRRKGRMLAWATADYLLVPPQYHPAGDHGAGWETSHLLALHPETVDLSLLPKKGDPVVGVGGAIAPQDATAEFGWETLEAAARILVKEAQHRLEHPRAYQGHGYGLQEGLWKTEKNA